MSDYLTLKVKEVVRETADTVTIKFKQPLFKKVKYMAGQYLTTITSHEGKQERRSYSMSSAPGFDTTVNISVKRVEGGVVSNFLNDSVKAGDSIEIMKPMGNFLWNKDSAKRKLILVGAGSGITPLFSILRSALFQTKDVEVALLYGSRNQESIIFKSHLDELENKFGERLKVVHTLSQDDSWTGEKGRISSASIDGLMDTLGWDVKSVAAYLCGPQEMMEMAKGALEGKGISGSNIFHESFFISKENQATTSDEPFDSHEVEIVVNGQSDKVMVPAGKTILDAALDAGVNMPFSCQSGLCTACMGKCTSGEVKMVGGDALSEDEINDGFVLTCVGHPSGSGVKIEIG